MHNKPFSQACENNKTPILEILQRRFTCVSQLLEIGSGTGQHAVYFSAALPHILWQPSDRAENLAGIHLWLDESAHTNILPPLELDVMQRNWPGGFDAIFSANTAHIMPWEVAQQMIIRAGQGLPATGLFALYGPFNYQGNYTSESNRRFDAWLKSVDPRQGIRDFERVNEAAVQADLELIEDNSMPANNRLLIWQKR